MCVCVWYVYYAYNSEGVYAAALKGPGEYTAVTNILSPSLFHTHTHTHARTHARTRTHTHTHTHNDHMWNEYESCECVHDTMYSYQPTFVLLEV